MFHSILVPLDGSSFAELALPLAASIAARSQAVLHLVVVHPWGTPEDAPRPGSRADREVRKETGAYLNRLTQTLAASYQIPICEAVIEGTTTAGPLVEHARRNRVELVVASTHEHGPFWRWISSGVARHLIHRLDASVLLIKPQLGNLHLGLGGFDRIVVALDGSPLSEPGLEQAQALGAPGALITLVEAVAGDSTTVPQQRAEAQGYLQDLAERTLPHGSWEVVVLTAGNPAEALLEYAESRGMDLIVLTTRAQVPLSRVLLGTMADHVLHRATLPVLVCHQNVPARTQLQRPR